MKDIVVDIALDAERWLDANISHDALIAVPALFVALLVPIAFFLMERQDLYGFDKNVILDKIIVAKLSISLVFMVSIALLFNISALSALLTIVLLATVIVVLIRVYKWMVSVEILRHKTTYKQNMRLKFIRGIKNDIEKVDTWAIILNDENLLEKNQRGLVAEFIATVKNLKDGKNKYPKSNLLGLMSRNINKIDFTDIKSYEDLVKYAIEYFPEMRAVRTNKKQATGKDKKIDYPPYQQRELAINLLKIALDRNVSDIFDHIYYTAIQKYVAKGDVNESDFIRDFLPTYINVVKENEKFAVRGLWQELTDWVVTKTLLSNKESWNKASSLLNAYMESINHLARLSAKLSDHEVRVIDDLTALVLPNVNASLWFDIITFYNSSYGLDEGEDSIHARIRNYVSEGRFFGLVSGASFSWSIHDEEAWSMAYEGFLQMQEEETLYMLGLILPWLYDPNETQKVLDQIKIIKGEKLFEPDSIETRRLESLKIRFKKIQAYTAKTIAMQNSNKEDKAKTNS